MALTISKVLGADYVSGNKKVKVRDITFDSAYVTAGEALTPAQVGLRKIEQAYPSGLFRNADGTLAIDVSYDRTNKKLLAYETAASASSPHSEVTSEDDISAYTGRMTFIGV
jgi:hypothetical protein